MTVLVAVLLLNTILFGSCGYPPIGNEVQPGSVLLPASRRGRYLANIVRRQAVDGTGIKFNKDADRMNAEAKKKVDVLSEELLPYIIAEQERRTTLYKRVMTAIQNGEKGVTIAEIRNKPPLIIRKGLMFRCPLNRAPKEPDGSGIIMCEENIEPSPVMFDSCLSAEDKDLYIADNKYFFCNRHKVEGPDLPRNGTTVIGCAPMERTSLNYTSAKCALEDTDDVVVHYRYYPDRTYKFVTELDPDREVCDHWNPCQIGYIYSLPSPDQALPANELWQFVPQDSILEFIHSTQVGNVYETIPRRIKIPHGFKFDGVWRVKDPHTSKANLHHKVPAASLRTEVSEDSQHIIIQMSQKWANNKYGLYHAVFTKETAGKTHEKSIDFVQLEKATIQVMNIQTLEFLPGQRAEPVQIPYRCTRCELDRVMVRAIDFNVYNIASSRYKVIETPDRQTYIEINLEVVGPKDIGYFIGEFRDREHSEEFIKFLIINFLKVSRIKMSSQVGDHVVRTVKFGCTECDVTDVLCNGESVAAGGRVTVVKPTSVISFSFPSYEDKNSCVYMAVFNRDNAKYRKVIAVMDNASPLVAVSEPAPLTSPAVGDQLEAVIPMSCDECSVHTVSVNGIQLEPAPARRSGTGTIAYYMISPSTITIRISDFSPMYEGVYQAVFDVKGQNVTKTLLEVRNAKEKVDEANDDTTTENVTGVSELTTAHAEDESTSAAAESVTTETPAPTEEPSR